MLTISVWPRRLKEFLLTHPLYKSPTAFEAATLLRPTPYSVGIAATALLSAARFSW